MLPHADQFSRRDPWGRPELCRVSAQRTLALPRLRKRRHSLAQLCKQIALGCALDRHLRFHVDLLDSSSAFSIAFSALRCLGAKSAISSLSYSVYNQNCTPVIHQW